MAPEIDADLLMGLLERLGHSIMNIMNIGWIMYWGTIGLDDGQSTDPFDWVDMDMVTNSHCVDMGNWYVETCGDDVEMGDKRLK